MTESEMIILRILANSANIEPCNESLHARGVVDGMQIIGASLNKYLDGKDMDEN